MCMRLGAGRPGLRWKRVHAIFKRMSQELAARAMTQAKSPKTLDGGGCLEICRQGFPLQKRGKQPTNQGGAITKVFKGYPKRSAGQAERFRGTQKRRRPAALSISGRETQRRGCMGKGGKTRRQLGPSVQGLSQTWRKAKRHAFAERKSAVVRRRCQYQGERRKGVDVWERPAGREGATSAIFNGPFCPLSFNRACSRARESSRRISVPWR